MRSILRAFLACVVLAAALGAVFGDEGMWTFDNPPARQLRERYGFDPTQEWLDHVRLSSVRFPGGSGSFVSADGLVLTNHHVGLDSIQKVSGEGRDYVKNGFLARTREEEIRCPDLELVVLDSIDDVTGRVQAVSARAKSDEERTKLLREETAKIEKEEGDRTGLRCNVVTLYKGGVYAVYRYRRHTDVRLVFAPEQQVAFYGGDPDNFTYPRWCLDFSLFRVWEGGKPYRTPHWLRWSAAGPSENDLVFVSGNPGSTGRLDTVAQMEYFRDVSYPRVLRLLAERLQALRAYAARDAEAERRSLDTIFGIENSLKAVTGYLKGLRAPEILDRKRREEDEFRKVAETAAAFDAIVASRRVLAEVTDRSVWATPAGTLFQSALDIVRMVSESAKPEGERLPRYRQSGRAQLERSLYSEAPVHPDMEEVLLASSLGAARKNLKPGDPLIAALLGDRSPEETARAWIAGTRLAAVAARRELVEAGPEGLASSEDTLIEAARRVDPLLRELEARIDREVTGVEAAAGEVIARARFAAFGRSVYPDATFTLRLSYGAVKGYESGTTLVPWRTTFFGLYERNAAFGNRPPFHLPERWQAARQRLDLATPFNFVCTTDIIGGNSGSPVISRSGELVGLIFDGNIESLSNRFVYDEAVARAVAVHSSAIVEALRKVYDAGALADELLPK